MKICRGIAAALMGVALLGLTACGGGDDSDDVASSDTTAAVSQTTEAERSTTTAVSSGVSPCLTSDELTSLAGSAPSEVTPRENRAKKWPSGECRYRWANAETSFYIDVRGDAGAYYDQQVASAKSDQYKEELPNPGLGDKSFMARNTGNSSVTGLISLTYVQRGGVYLSQNFADGQNSLKGSREASIQLAIAIARAQLDKISA